jgi:Xaa-Pro dipeptidase
VRPIEQHDVGGYLPHRPKRPTEAGFKGLRTATILEAGMVITIEPGVYFIEHLIDQALANPEQAKFIDQTVLSRFRTFGGVRLEDDVVVTSDGVENLSWTPRTVNDVEAVCQGKITSRFELECPYVRH